MNRVVQKSLEILEIQIQLVDGKSLDEDEISKLKELVQKTLGYDHLFCSVVTIDDFGEGKFEAFVSEIKSLKEVYLAASGKARYTDFV